MYGDELLHEREEWREGKSRSVLQSAFVRINRACPNRLLYVHLIFNSTLSRLLLCPLELLPIKWAILLYVNLNFYQ